MRLSPKHARAQSGSNSSGEKMRAKHMLERGLEPLRLAAPDPKSGASAISPLQLAQEDYSAMPQTTSSENKKNSYQLQPSLLPLTFSTVFRRTVGGHLAHPPFLRVRYFPLKERGLPARVVLVAGKMPTLRSWRAWRETFCVRGKAAGCRFHFALTPPEKSCSSCPRTLSHPRGPWLTAGRVRPLTDQKLPC